MGYITYGKWRNDSQTGISTRNVYRVTKFMGLFEVKKKVGKDLRVPKNDLWLNVYEGTDPFLKVKTYWVGALYQSESEAIQKIDTLGQGYIKTIKIEI